MIKTALGLPNVRQAGPDVFYIVRHDKKIEAQMDKLGNRIGRLTWQIIEKEPDLFDQTPAESTPTIPDPSYNDTPQQ